MWLALAFVSAFLLGCYEVNKKMALDDRIGYEEAKILIQEYRKEKKGEK